MLFDRYAILLLGVCMKYLKNEDDARDSVQHIFLKMLSDLHRHDVQYFRAWIYQVARNHCLMQLRQKSDRFKEGITDRHLQNPADDTDKSAFIQKDQLLEHMEQALVMLSSEQRTCVERFYLQKQSYQLIAEQTGFTLLQVKSYIQNGKRNLKLLLDKIHSH